MHLDVLSQHFLNFDNLNLNKKENKAILRSQVIY